MKTSLFKLIACAAMGLVLQGAALAADAAPPSVKAAAASLLSGYPYETSGPFVGIYTEGGGGPVNATVPGVGSASLTTTSAGAGISLGYAWGRKGSNFAASCQANFGWTNFNGSTVGMSLSGPLALEQECTVYTPLSNIAALLPNFPSLGSIPPFPTTPGVTVTSPIQMGFLVGMRENDISTFFTGLPAMREWRFAPEIGIVAMQQLSNATAVKAWVKTVFPDKGICSGPVPGACSNTGQQVLAGVGYVF